MFVVILHFFFFVGYRLSSFSFFFFSVSRTKVNVIKEYDVCQFAYDVYQFALLVNSLESEGKYTHTILFTLLLSLIFFSPLRQNNPYQLSGSLCLYSGFLNTCSLSNSGLSGTSSDIDEIVASLATGRFGIRGSDDFPLSMNFALKFACAKTALVVRAAGVAGVSRSSAKAASLTGSGSGMSSVSSTWSSLTGPCVDENVRMERKRVERKKERKKEIKKKKKKRKKGY